uniref:Uncharacterized protein n=1 Tax=Catharus ustulatus TaxID=91951 RepID=A0A8C3V139_CATUS
MLASLTQSPQTPVVISRCVQAAAPSKPSQLYPTAGSSPSAFPQRQTWVFKSKELMVKASSAVPEGSLVYVREGSNAFLRTPTGWSRLLVPGAMGIPSPSQHRQGLTPSRKGGAETSIPPCHPQLRLAALNVPLSGDMSGIRGADLQCYRQSQEAGLYGTFRAFLSSPTQHLVSIVKRTDRTLPIVNLKGQLLAKSWSSLFGGQSGAALQGPIYSFNGRNILLDPLWPRRLAWHGSTPRGGHARRWDCQGWRSSGTAEGVATALGEGRLLAGQRHNCSTPLAVLCIEVAFPYRHMW